MLSVSRFGVAGAAKIFALRKLYQGTILMKFARCTLFVLLFFMAHSTSTDAQEANLDSLQTIAESSGFTKTSTSAEVEEFIKTASAAASHVSSHSIGKTTQGRDIMCVTVSKKPYAPGDDTGSKNVVLILGNIHSGECAGKEALLQMIRELGLDPDAKWLQKNILLFVPNYSADANDQMGPQNRPGQVGPDVMGRRANPQRLDLNRDFVKLEAPETRALVGLINKANPHLFIDCHTTNGSKHQYPLTYDTHTTPRRPNRFECGCVKK